MMAGSHCGCLVCRLEQNLVGEFEENCAGNQLGTAVDPSGILARFQTPLELVRALHTADAPASTNWSDHLLLELLREHAHTSGGSIWQKLLLLVFIPTIHRTTSQVAGVFPCLVREDVSQHVLAVFLEFLRSPDLKARRSHIAFTIARKLRRTVFRWAIHESRLAIPEEMCASSREDFDDRDPLDAESVLKRFLDNCQRAGWLSHEERHLLLEFKIEGQSCRDLAERNGHSAVAIQHRIQRVVDRLRRLAEKAPPHQLELFPR